MTWIYSVRSLIKNVIYLKGDPWETRTKKYPKEGYGLRIERGNCLTKMYDKANQFGLACRMVRTECSCKTKQMKKLGYRTFFDLSNNQSHVKYCFHLLKVFRTLLIFQPEIFDNPLLSTDDRDFLYQHNNPNNWVDLRKKSKDKSKKTGEYYFQKDKKRFLVLINKYCAINYTTELLNLIEEKISLK